MTVGHFGLPVTCSCGNELLQSRLGLTGPSEIESVLSDTLASVALFLRFMTACKFCKTFQLLVIITWN